MAPDGETDARTRSLFAEIIAAQERFSLIEAGMADPGGESPPLEVTVEELRSALEELVVAGEELEAQQVQLIESRQRSEDQTRRYQGLFALAPEAYLVTDAFGMVREANRAAAELMGVRPEFIAGKALALFVDEEDRRQFRAGLAALPTAPLLQRWPVRMQRRDGTRFAAEVTVRSVREPDGNVRSALWQVRDASEQVQLEQALRSLSDQLEARVSARTQELSAANEHLTTGLREVSALSEQLQHALDSRVVIEQAKGRLMEGLSIGPDAAFEVLRRQARDSGRKLRDVAGDLVDGVLQLNGPSPVPPARRGAHSSAPHRADTGLPRSPEG